MRFATINAIYEAALQDERICFITGDLNHVKEEEFKKNLKDRYINAGLSEQNIVGMAAGMALTGMKVFVYSIVPFITMRCYEQVKDDVCYQNLDVTLIGIGGGLIYGQYGNTHCSIEDIAVMRVLPNMKIICPANPLEAEQLTKQVIKKGGPTYIRIGRGKEPMPKFPYKAQLGKGYIAKKGKDITIFSTGTILQEAEKAANLLQKKGISTEVINLHTVKPLDKTVVVNTINKRKGVFTMEDHNYMGGLGGAVAELLLEAGYRGIFKRYGVKDIYLSEIGSEEYLRNRHGISGKKVAASIYSLLK